VHLWTETGPNERINFTQSLVIDPTEGHGELRTSGGILAVDWLLWPDLTFSTDDWSQISSSDSRMSALSSTSSTSSSSSSSESSESDDNGDEKSDSNESNSDDEDKNIEKNVHKHSVRKTDPSKYAALASHGMRTTTTTTTSTHTPSVRNNELRPLVSKWNPRVVVESHTHLHPSQIGLPDCGHHSTHNLRYRHSNVALAASTFILYL
jgi:hypothetical protein